MQLFFGYTSFLLCFHTKNKWMVCKQFITIQPDNNFIVGFINSISLFFTDDI